MTTAEMIKELCEQMNISVSELHIDVLARLHRISIRNYNVVKL